MADCTNILESEIAVPGISVEIRNYTAPVEMVSRRYDRHSLTTWLHPRPDGILAGIDDDPPWPRLHALKGLFYVPAYRRAVAAHVGENAIRRVAVVRLADDRIAAVTDRACEWDAECFLSPAFKNIEAIRRQCGRLAEEALAPGFASEVFVEAMGLELIVMLARGFQRTSQPELRRAGGLAGWQMRRLTDRINSEGDGPLMLADLADLVGLSARHLSRAFHAETGHTLASHIQQLRIEKARLLLRKGHLPLKAISARLGFAAQQCFTTSFQRATGHTPSAYRRRACQEGTLD